MTGADILVAYAGICSFFFAAILIGYEFLKKGKKENEVFARSHAEDAMRIKARQYQDRD